MVARRMSSSSRPHTLIRGKGAGVGAWVAVEETGVTKGARVRVAVCTRAGRARVHALSPPARAPLRAGLGWGAYSASALTAGMLRDGGSPPRPVGLDDLVHAPRVDERARRHHHQCRSAALRDVARCLNRSVASLRGHILRAKQHGAQPSARTAVRRAPLAWIGVGGVSLTMMPHGGEPKRWPPKRPRLALLT